MSSLPFQTAILLFVLPGEMAIFESVVFDYRVNSEKFLTVVQLSVPQSTAAFPHFTF